MRILLIEDDESFATLIQKTLNDQYYLVDWAKDGEIGRQMAESFSYDLILLDLILPKLNGLHFCQQRRQEGDRTPILLMTAEETNTSKIAGLDAGADDYLIKPFNLDELLARVRALLRRGHDALTPILEWGALKLDSNKCQVNYQEKILKLTAKEYSLLELFLRHPRRIFNQAALLDHLWSFDEPPSENAVRTQMKSLRQKLKKAGADEVIETIYGLGYRLKEKTVKDLSGESKSSSSINLDLIWQKQKHKYQERISILEQAVQALKVGKFDIDLQQKALREAHTLAGSLGSFGFQDASQTSRQIENLLQINQDNYCLQLNQLSTLIFALKEQLNFPSSASPSLPKFSSTLFPHLKSARLLIVDDDTVLAEMLVAEAIAWGMLAYAAYSLDEARSKIQQQLPDVVLLDLSFPESTEAGFELLAELVAQNPPVPVIVFTAKESFADRVTVARLGGRGFLQKPISPTQVIETISHILQKSQSDLAKLLIVDDNLEMLDWLRALLEPWGLQLVLLNDPQQFWLILEQTHPDLIILGIDLPGVSGIELCQVVRNDPKWNELPVLILSSQRDSEIVQQVFMAGADDYIQKPIVEPELIARVFNRLERRQLRHKMVTQCYLPSTAISNQ